MSQTTFNIEDFLCTGDPAIAVQLAGPPILISIDCITIFRNIVELTEGVLPYRSRFGTITAACSDFDELVAALNDGKTVKLHITYDKVPGTRLVTGIELEIATPALARIERDLSATLEVTRDIRAEVGADLGAVVMELKKTNALLNDRLPKRRTLSQMPETSESIAATALENDAEDISQH